MATYNILTAHTGAGTQQLLATGDSLFLASSGTLNSLGANGAKSTGGDNDLQIYGTLAGGDSAFLGAAGGDLIQIYADATVLGGVVSAITVDGTGDNAFSNAGDISTHTTKSGTHVIDLEGNDNAVVNTGSIVAGQYGSGVYLDGGSNTFNNSGTITAGTAGTAHALGSAVRIVHGGASSSDLQSITNSGSIAAERGVGIFVDGGSNDVSNTSAGSINGSFFGLELFGGHNTVSNAGSIAGGVGVIPNSDQSGIYISGSSNSVYNAGTVTGVTGVAVGGSANTITNAHHGHIVGNLADGLFVDAGGNVITNGGFIVGAETGIALESGGNTLTNSGNGHIVGQGVGDDALLIEDGTNTITNRGHISGAVDGQGIHIFGASNDIANARGALVSERLDNAASVHGHYAIWASGGHNTITNDGTIAVQLGDGNDISNMAVLFIGGDNSITNQHSGVITDGTADNTSNWAINMFGGGNAVTNYGHITGIVSLGADSDGDSFSGASGHFNGTIYGGNGNDAIELGKGTSTVYGGEGADFLQAGDGHNSFNYTSALDSYGSGHFDTVDDFNAAKDSFNFLFEASDTADFRTLDGEALTDSNFDADLRADIGRHLHANSAVLLNISGGEYAGDSFLVVDGNNHAGYQAGADYVIELQNVIGTFSASDIHDLI